MLCFHFYHFVGLMLDVARHFQPIKLLKRTIDGMENLKMNLLHLHLTDAASFPLLLDDDPILNLNLSLLAKKSAFGAHKYYTKQQLMHLVQYAKERRVEIIPELEGPAHSLSWGEAFQDVVIYCNNIAERADHPKDIYPIDPSNEKTYLLIRGILKQLFEIFPTKYIHLGGDEVNDQCWRNSTKLMDWTEQMNISIWDITKYYEKRLFQIIYEMNKIPIVWQGVFDNSAIPDVEDDPLNNDLPSIHQQQQEHPHFRGGNAGRKRLHTSDRRPQKTRNNNNRNNHHNDDPNNRKAIGRAAHTFPQGRRLLTAEHDLQNSNNILFRYHLNLSQAEPSSTNNQDSSEESSSSSTEYPTIIEPWKCWNGLAIRTAVRAVKTNHPVFMSACWYLDFRSDWTTFLALNLIDSTYFELDATNPLPTHSPSQSPSSTSSPTSSDSSAVPSSSPTETASSGSNLHDHENYFLGGEGAMWSETVDHTSFECRLWPRYSAIAYRLWGLGSYFCDLLLSELDSIPMDYHQNYYFYFCDKYYPQPINVSLTTEPVFFTPKYPFRNEKIVIPLNLITTKVLYASYIQYKYYLTNALMINSAEITFHYPSDVLPPNSPIALRAKSMMKSMKKPNRNANNNNNSNNKENNKIELAQYVNYIPSFPTSMDEMLK
jgi:hypothetical protein